MVGAAVVGAVLLAGGEWAFYRWWNNQPSPAPAPIALDVSQNPQVGHRIIIHATTSGKVVKWLQLGGPTTLGPDQLWPEADPHEAGMVTDTKGDYVIEG